MGLGIGWGILGAGLLGAAGSVVGAGEQASGQQAAAGTQQSMFNTIVGQQQPFMQAGYGATTALNQLLGTSPTTGPGGTAGGTGLPGGYMTQTFQPTQAQLNAYPGYQFALNAGGQATRNADTPGVGALSGPALKDLTNFNVGTANQYYGNYFNQFQQQQSNIFGRLSAIAGLGQNAAANTGTAGTQLGTGIAQAGAAAAGSQAAGTVGATNSIANSAVPLSYLLAGQSGSSAASNLAQYTPGGGYGLSTTNLTGQ